MSIYSPPAARLWEVIKVVMTAETALFCPQVTAQTCDLESESPEAAPPSNLTVIL